MKTIPPRSYLAVCDKNEARPAAKGSEASTSSIDKKCFTIIQSKSIFHI
jgi:hypothetical protein